MIIDDFIRKAKLVHGEKYDYSEVVYVNNQTPIRIVCPVHGEFVQRAGNHLQGAGCPKCGKAAMAAKQRIWTKERCFEEARKYSSKVEFLKANAACYRWCRKEGFFDEMDWFVSPRQAHGFWKTEEGHRKCLEIARKYKTLREFIKGDEAVYNVARVYGYIDEMIWLERTIHSERISSNNIVKASNNKKNISGKNRHSGGNNLSVWTKERCAEEALKFSTRSQFRKESLSAYKKASKEGWLDEICAHMVAVGNRFKRCIYAYEFPDINGNDYVYVGLTGNLIRRKGEHKIGNSSVKEFVEANGLEFPEPVQKTDYVSVFEARILEGTILDEYLDEGWLALNKAKTGALGGRPSVWDVKGLKDLIIREKVSSRRDLYRRFGGAYNSALSNGWLNELFGEKPENIHPKGYWNDREHVFEEATKYTHKIDFIHNAGAAYLKAKKEGWLEEMDWLDSAKMPAGYWLDKENVLAESRKYKTMSEFRDAPNKAYETAKANRWLEEMTWLELSPLDPGYFSKERIFAFARGCETRTEFHDKYGQAYNIANKNGWLDEMTWFKELKHRWTKEEVFEVARKYSTRLDFKEKDGTVYSFAWRKGWLEEMQWLRLQIHGVWTREEVFAEARKFSSRGELRKGNASAYNAARNNGWLDEMTWFVSKRHENWNRESVFEESKKYKTRSEFQRNCSAGYAMARRNGWIEEMVWLKKQYHEQWTREEVFEEAKKHSTIAEFRKENVVAYNIARRNGWLEEFDWLKLSKLPNGYWTREKVFEASRKFSSRTEFCKKAPTAYDKARENGWLEEMTWLINKRTKDNNG